MEDIERTGLVTQEERLRIGDEENTKGHGKSNWGLPLAWIVQIANQDENISTSNVFALFNVQVTQFRAQLTRVLSYGHVSIPLAYSQVVHMIVYIYFGTCLVAEQWLIYREEGDLKIDLYFPIFMTFKFLFYMGWLRVAEALYNPFGEDDDDFNLIELINRHLKVGLLMVNKTEEPPALIKDAFWDQSNPILVANLHERPQKIKDEIEMEAAVIQNDSTTLSDPSDPLDHLKFNLDETERAINKN